ncbi:MAG: helix-turn-helix transcriptional regulator [Candidatus Omnitrophica bacterium]|nr:helix-turn-helix transcriptional regulator [Candidatus Omnitrophota bacterium]
MDIGKYIEKLLKERDIQQKSFAVAIGVGQATVSHWISGRQEPNPTQRKKICEYFKITEAELFGALPQKVSPEILEALQDPVAVRALLITHKNSQDIKNTIKALLETLPNLSAEKRQAILALCK